MPDGGKPWFCLPFLYNQLPTGRPTWCGAGVALVALPTCPTSCPLVDPPALQHLSSLCGLPLGRKAWGV